MSPSEGPKREDSPPPRDRTLLWAVGGAAALFLIVVAAVFMIEDEPKEDGAPTPSPKSSRPRENPVEAFNATLRRIDRRAGGLASVVEEEAYGGKITAEVIDKHDEVRADIDELREIASRLPLSASERDLLSQRIQVIRDLWGFVCDALARTVESDKSSRPVLEQVAPELMKLTRVVADLEQHPAAGTLWGSLGKIGVDTELTRNFLMPIDEE